MNAHGALFLRQFVQSPRSVGAVLPSSRALARAVLAPIDFSAARTIVEFGPGTGAFTDEIARRLAPGSRYLGIELNPRFTDALAARFPGLTFVAGSAAQLGNLLVRHGIRRPVDAIVSGLPWATLPTSLQRAVFGEMDRALAPGGQFVTFGYLQSLVMPAAWTLRRRLRRSFAEVATTPVIWANVPPAFAYVCRKSG